MKLTSFSWEIRSEICAVKTVDATLINEGTTGIPMDVAPFFFGSQLDEGEERSLDFVVLGSRAKCKITRKNNRHRLFFMELKKALAAYQLKEGDLLFFDKHPSQSDSYIVSAILDNSREIIPPDILPNSTIGENRGTYTYYRVGHELFSEQVRRRFSYCCCVTGVNDLFPRVLIASHIKPWCLSDGMEKVDPFNGLLLAPHIDKLFDQGHMSFSDKGKAVIGSSVLGNVNKLWKIETCRLDNLANETRKYLAFHRELHQFTD